MRGTSRGSKRQYPKRTQVLDDEGWTHVATTTKNPDSQLRVPIPALDDRLTPAEIPDGLTFQKLRDQYEWHREVWQASTTWAAVKTTLEAEFRNSGTAPFDNCVCIGLGSLSGLLRGGMVDRRSVSLFQLAALVSMLEFTSHSNPVEGDPPITPVKCYAQDPVFNCLDKELLNFVGIQVVQDPDAFSLVNEHTFLYAPGAETTHLIRLLSEDPVVYFGAPLREGPSGNIHSASSNESIDGFIRTRRATLLPEFHPNAYAFFKIGFLWRDS